MTLVLFALASFLIGSIPFGYVIGVLIFKTDIRKSGSGNIGAMNAMRTIGKGGAVAVLLLDSSVAKVPVAEASRETTKWSKKGSDDMFQVSLSSWGKASADSTGAAGGVLTTR